MKNRKTIQIKSHKQFASMLLFRNDISGLIPTEDYFGLEFPGCACLQFNYVEPNIMPMKN
jgi:hypothetical protein